MANKKLEQLVMQLENYSECWKQFEEHMKACMVLFGPGGQIPDEDAKRACFEGAREALYACLD